MGPFMQDKDGKCYLIVIVDPFSKWVNTCAVPLLHSWRAAELLYDDLVACWGKLHFIWTDNSVKFVGSLAWIHKGLSIILYKITIGKSKVNGR